jgi:hypothetical protein
VLMQSEGLSMSSALELAAEAHDAEVHKLQTLADELPDFGAENDAVARYVDLLQRWVRGHLDWSALTGRYRAG